MPSDHTLYLSAEQQALVACAFRDAWSRLLERTERQPENPLWQRQFQIVDGLLECRAQARKGMTS